MEAEEGPSAIESAVSTGIESAVVTVAATASPPNDSEPDQSAVTGGGLSDDLKPKQIDAVASKKRPRKEFMAAQRASKKPRKRTKCTAAQTAEPVNQHIAPRRSSRGTQAENEEVTLVTISSTGNGWTQSEDVVPITKESKRRKNGPGKRGPSTGSKAEQIRKRTGNKISVNLDPEHGRPTDKGVSSLLSNECGKIVREKCPMVHETWTKISRDVKHNLRKEVEANFDVDVQRPSIIHYLNKLMGKVYREFKCELHKHYKNMRSLEEALDKPPKAMIARNDPAQWKCLCKHFSEEKFKKKSETNAKNRAGKEYEHCGGSRPHGLYFQDKVQEGSKFPAIETFRVTHLKKGSNEWISNKSGKESSFPISKLWILKISEAIGEVGGMSMGSDNTWVGKKPLRRIGGMSDALSIASDLGFSVAAAPTPEELQNWSSSTGEKGDNLIRVLRELTSVQRKIADLQVELQGRKDDKNVSHLTHVSEMEKKCETLSRITTILKDVIQNKDRIISRLQQPYSLDCIPVEAEYQKQFSELLMKAASDYGALTASVADFQWSQTFKEPPSVWGEMLRPIPVALASCTRFFEAMSAMRESFATLQQLRVGHSDTPSPITPAKDSRRVPGVPDCVTPPPWKTEPSFDDLAIKSSRRPDIKHQEAENEGELDSSSHRRLSWPPSVKNA